MIFQLFHVMPSITLVHSGVKHKDGNFITSQIITNFPFLYWPSGKPCEPANMYFLDIAHEATGNSLRTYASKLSHLIRYCGENNISIESLTDQNIYSLSEKLQKEKSKRKPIERARNDNTVRSILSQAIKFLQWYQKNIMLLLPTPLIGEKNVSPQITVERVKNNMTRSKAGHVEYYYTHSAMPTSESKDPKRPIALPIIEDIQRFINRQSLMGERSKRFVQRYRDDPTLLEAQLEYIRARRHFMIWMMSHTGLRPSELVEMSVKAHENILTTRTLKIPTKKRRKKIAPIRSFPIVLNAASVVHRYLISRKTYCAILKDKVDELKPNDCFFLTLEGKPIEATSLEKDFERLANRSGYKDVQVCLSMFRHRFITYEVIAHLKEFINTSGKSRQMMTDIDYESILKRISAKTGHGSPKSLWNYIDLAWEELNVWGSIDKAIARLHAADQLFSDLLALQHETINLGNRQANRKISLQLITDRIGEIISTAKQEIEVHQIHGKHIYK